LQKSLAIALAPHNPIHEKNIRNKPKSKSLLNIENGPKSIPYGTSKSNLLPTTMITCAFFSLTIPN